MVDIMKREIPEHNKTIYMLGPLILADGSVVTIAMRLSGNDNILRISSWEPGKSKDAERR
ncbi:MAG: hypothetical protein HQ547_04490 [Candidatus Omnitrophica bacterium]|nr:hypothetical protein [Candidatus Omnitrophota bacterium]